MGQRFSFLPLFFVSLTIVFSVLLFLRIRARQAEMRTATRAQPAADAAPGEQPHLAVPTPVPAPGREEARGRTSSVPTTGEASRTGLEPAQPAVVAASAKTIDAVWFDPQTISTGAKGALHIRPHPGIDVKSVSGVLRNPSAARMPFTCVAGADATWTCAIAVGGCAPCGRWSIERLDVTTAAGPMALTPPAVAASAYITAARCDTAPPVLNNISASPVDTESNSSDVMIMLTAVDPGCGIASIAVTLRARTGETMSVAARQSGDEDSWAARVVVGRNTRRGSWRVTSVELTDEAGNVRSYSEGDPALAAPSFDIH